MKDEVRITVLATGFDQRPPAPAPVAAASGRTVLAASGRSSQGGMETATAPDPVTQRQPADNDVDIPAFLRRR